MFDDEGFVQGAQRKGLHLDGRRVALFGAAAAGTAIACALARVGMASIALIDSDDERVAALAPLVVRCASELSELWHLRRIGRPSTPAGGVAVAA